MIVMMMIMTMISKQAKVINKDDKSNVVVGLITKRAHHDASEEDENIDDENALVEENIAEKEIRRSELHQTVRIREGRGLSILQTYTLNMTRILQTHDERDRCVSWYRKQTRKIRRNPAKHIKFCRELNDHLEDCVKNLVFSDIEKEHHSHNTIVSLAIGSKLYCEDQTGANKLLGIHRQGVLCLQAENQMVIEQKFSDIAGLSDIEKNQNVLDFIDENSKFRAEFGHDCHDTKELVEVDIDDKEYQVKVKQLKTKRE
ncbi:hypothetical protein I4U23_009069 [Adineta vaga]|nr:hypothetical protein I4U23_009069 [Adineta vaga]